MSDAYQRINLGEDASGHPITLNRRTHVMFQEVEHRLGFNLTIVKGSYLAAFPGGKSAHTHDKGGVLDARTWNLTDEQRNNALAVARQVGFIAWYRTKKDGDFDPHMHWVARGDAELHDEAQAQVDDAAGGLNGLQSKKKDNLNLDVPTFDYDAYMEASMQSHDVAGKDRDGDPFDFSQAAVRGVFAYDAVRDGGGVDKRLDILEGRVTADTNARAQFAYQAVTDGGAVDERLKRLQQALAVQAEQNRRLTEAVARLTAKVNALSP